MPIAYARTMVPDDRKHHVRTIVRLLHASAAKSGVVPSHAVSKSLLRLALKMEKQLFEATHGRTLTDDMIRHHLVALASRAVAPRQNIVYL